MSIRMTAAHPTRATKPTVWKAIKQSYSAYLFISPFYILFLIFGLFPIIFSIYLAFCSWNGLGPFKFTGLQNFKFLLTDNLFWLSLYNTLIIWVESTIPTLLFALVVAFLLNAPFVRLKSLFRVMYFLPYVTSTVAVAIVFSSLFGSNFGLINAALQIFGVHRVDWVNNAVFVQIAVSCIVIWRSVGYNAVIYLGGLQSIPNELYEAATLDGASWSQIFRRITMPMLRPVIVFTVILSTIGGMQIFAEPQILTGGSGGASYGGLTSALYQYNMAFGSHYYGYASAVSWALFVVIAVFSYVNWKLTVRGE